ncbi:hypothetical protein BN14_11338 [Rhizoctonia solani AG-1 IB]|uniref:Retrotransposon gag domain-containing protein n=1 Tax=Thanatephorus cucumeris (strain AG1-IB / isolate 7/3/14) TaxID=1108050 RepID=M5CD50_THACB|nr:hypothetical protein BN14_11338 [Rhizoctonia solani AG-1 IB]
MHNLATIMGRALSVLLQSTFRSLSQTPGPVQPKSKIPAPEKDDGKKGPAAKSFILDCKTYFSSNSSSFPLDHSHISFLLMNLKGGQPKKWGQVYLEKLLHGVYEPIPESWDAFEAAFLCNWSNPAAAQVAERCLRNLKQSRAASNYATDFKIIASKLEWLDAVLIAAFHQGLKAEVRSKLIEFTLHKNITTFEAHQELRKDSKPSASAPCPAQGISGDFVSRSMQEQHQKAGECTKCREKSHKWEECKNGWCLKSSEHPKPESGNAAEVEDLYPVPTV